MKRIVALLPLFICLALRADSEYSYSVNIEKKIEAMHTLVKKAVPFFKKHSIPESCSAFRTDSRWRYGEMGIFVFNSVGVCFVFGQEYSVIWEDYYDERAEYSDSFIVEMLEVGKKGGIVNFHWNNATMQAYVRTVQKDGETYIIGAGFYPDSATFATKELVNAAVRYGEEHTARELFEQINNPNGRFVHGDIYLYVYDFNGNVMAHGESAELIGQNVIDEKTSDGKYRAREMIAIAKTGDGNGWYTYKSMQGDLEKRVYIQRFTDTATGKQYMIAGGYYPELDANVVIGLVKRAVSYLRANGPERAFPEFSKRLGMFATGSAMLFAYDMNGIMRADMANPSFVGLSLMKSVDSEGKPIGKTEMEAAEEHPNGTWLGFSLRNSYQMVYIEKVSIPDGDFVVGAGYYPVDKYIHVRFMVDKAAQYLKTEETEVAFQAFASRDADFLRGDLSIFVYNLDGIILVHGQDRTRIWRDDRNLRDEKGRLISDRVASVARSGGGWFEYRYNNNVRRIYVELVEKEGGKKGPDSYIIGSGYYM